MEKIAKIIIWTGIAVLGIVPFLMDSHFFFPFIFTKALVFRIAVEIMLLAYLFLVNIDKSYRPRFTALTFILLAYIGILFVSSLLGDSFYFSFWGDIERSEGLITWLHLLALFIILSSFLRDYRQWLIAFDFLVGGSVLVSIFALGQKLDWQFVLNHGENRLSATIGNPAFLAGYLIFNVFFALFLLLERKSLAARLYYGLVIALGIFIIFGTATRGAMIGLLAGLLGASFLAVFFLKDYRRFRPYFLGFILAVAVFLGLAFANKQAAWVQNTEALRRLTSISLNDRTTQTRLMTWNSAWQGVKEKPFLGWGYENFFLVFNKYFNPKIYEDISSRIWFDRAHNIVFDQLIVGGAIGFFFYLLLLFYPVYFLFSRLVTKDRRLFRIIKKLSKEEAGVGRRASIIFIALLAAYFIQNLFVFDSLVTYLPFIFVLSFLGASGKSLVDIQSRRGWKTIFWVYVLLLWPILYNVDIKPAKANLTVIEAIQSQKKNPQSAYNLFLQTLAYNTYGNQEYRIRFAEFVDTLVYEKKLDELFLRQAALKVKEELNKQIAERPHDVANYIVLMRHYNRTYIYDPQLLNDVILKLFPQALALSPTRPHIYYEAGYAEINLGNYYKNLGKLDKAHRFYQDGFSHFDQAIALNPEVVESYVNPILMAFSSGEMERIDKYFQEMDQRHLPYRRLRHLRKMARAAVRTEHYDWAVKFYKDIVELEPDNPQNFVDLALSYIYSGDKENAIKIAQKVKEFGGEYARQAEGFIKQVSASDFKVEDLKAGR